MVDTNVCTLTVRDDCTAAPDAGSSPPGNRFFRTVLDGLRDLIFVVNHEGRLAHINPAAERTLRLSAHLLLNRPALELIHPDDRQTARGIFALDRDRPDSPPILRWRRADASWCPLEIRDRELLGTPGLAAVVLYCRDLERLALAEEALRQNEAPFRDAFAHTPVGMAITTLDGHFLQINPAYLALTGYSEPELLDRRDVDITHPDDRELHWQHVSQLLAAQLPACVLEKRYLKKDGGLVTARVTISLGRDSVGQPASLIILAENITEQRRLEQQYRQSQKMEAIGRLAGGVAHDFNNLLTVINGYGELLLKKVPPDDDAHKLLHEITRAGDRAARLTRQLLVFSRRQILAPRILDLNDILLDAGNMLRRLIGEDVDLVTTGDPGLWPIKADAGHIEQALMNLAVNARDAMPRGGQLTIETRNVRLDDTYMRTRPDITPGPYVMLAVNDTGCGMTPEVKAHLFEPFFTTKDLGKGTGLGLATVYGIVHEAGGHIEVYSELDVGSTFKLYFPRCDQAYTSSGKSHPGLPLMPAGRERILLVEDEDAVRALGRYVLMGCGYEVLDARHGEEALRVLEEQTGGIDLLLTDVVMPRLGGRALADRLKNQHPALKVLYLSGYTDDAVVRHGVLEEDVAFLQKPFSPAALAQKVREVLDTHAL